MSPNFIFLILKGEHSSWSNGGLAYNYYTPSVNPSLCNQTHIVKDATCRTACVTGANKKVTVQWGFSKPKLCPTLPSSAGDVCHL